MGELEEFREQVLDAVELDAELAGLEVDVRGQGGDLVAGLGAQGDFHGGGLEVFANAFELGHQPPTPALLIAERLAVSNGFELLDQLLAVEEESSAGLVRVSGRSVRFCTLRDCHITSDSIYRYLRQDLVVPFSMEGIAFNVECGDLFIGDLAGRVEV